MTSEIRANTLKNRVGLGTVSFTNTGPVVSGIVTANSFSGPYNGTDIVGTGITLTSTDAGSSAGPELKLFRNSASPADADYLGQLKFAGESDTGVERNYAKITGKILDASNGTEDGILEFAHIKAGSQTITGRWRSDSLQLLNDTNLSVAGDTTLTGDLDVDGHTNLDNVSIAGVTTVSNKTQVNSLGVGIQPIDHHHIHIESANPRVLIRSTGTNASKILFGDSSSNDSGVIEYHHGNNQMRFTTNNDGDRLVIEHDGKLQTNTSGQVAADFTTSHSSGAYTKYELGSNGAAIGYIGAGNQLGGGTVSDFAIRAEANLTFTSGGGTERYRVNSSGQVLIGTTTAPAYINRRLTVAQGSSGNTTVAIEVRSPTNGDGRIIFTDSTSSGNTGAYKGQIRYDQTNDFMSFNTNGDNERLRITSTGQLLLMSNSGYNPSSSLLSLATDDSAAANMLSDSSSIYNHNNPAFVHVQNMNNTGDGQEAGIILHSKSSFGGAWAIYGKRTTSGFKSDLIFRGRTGQNSSAESLRIDSTGVARFINSTGELKIASSTGNDGGKIILQENTLGAWSLEAQRANGYFRISDEYNGGAGSPQEYFRISTNGRVSISDDGTADGLLTIKGNSDATSNPSIRLLDGSDTREVSITNASGDFIASTHGTDNTQHGSIKIYDSGIIALATNSGAGNAERLRVDLNGSVRHMGTAGYWQITVIHNGSGSGNWYSGSAPQRIYPNYIDNRTGYAEFYLTFHPSTSYSGYGEPTFIITGESYLKTGGTIELNYNDRTNSPNNGTFRCYHGEYSWQIYNDGDTDQVAGQREINRNVEHRNTSYIATSTQSIDYIPTNDGRYGTNTEPIMDQRSYIKIKMNGVGSHNAIQNHTVFMKFTTYTMGDKTWQAYMQYN